MAVVECLRTNMHMHTTSRTGGSTVDTVDCQCVNVRNPCAWGASNCFEPDSRWWVTMLTAMDWLSRMCPDLCTFCQLHELFVPCVYQYTFS